MAGKNARAELLFDVQGPRERRLMRWVTVAVFAIVLILFAVALGQLWKNSVLAAPRWESVLSSAVLSYLLGGLWLSLFSGAVAGLIAAPLAVGLTVARLSGNKVTSTVARWWTELTRAVPVLLVIYFVQLFLPSLGLRTPVFWQLVLPLAIYHISILAEIFRAGIEAVPKGQTEAGESLGFSTFRIYALFILPQAVRISLPSLITQFIRLFKDTTFGHIVTYPELMDRGNIMGEYTGNLFQTFTVVLAIYLIIDVFLAWCARRLDERLRSPRGTRS